MTPAPITDETLSNLERADVGPARIAAMRATRDLTPIEVLRAAGAAAFQRGETIYGTGPQIWTVIADPCTGLLYESRSIWRDAGEAFRVRRQEFRPLQDATRALSTHDGGTVGENAAYLTPGEWMQSDGVLLELGGPS